MKHFHVWCTFVVAVHTCVRRYVSCWSVCFMFMGMVCVCVCRCGSCFTLFFTFVDILHIWGDTAKKSFIYILLFVKSLTTGMLGEIMTTSILRNDVVVIRSQVKWWSLGFLYSVLNCNLLAYSTYVKFMSRLFCRSSGYERNSQCNRPMQLL